MNKKMLLILGVLVAVVALASGMTIAYAKGNGNGNGWCSREPSSVTNCCWAQLCRRQGTQRLGQLPCFPEEGTQLSSITVNSDTKYRAWLGPNQDVTFDSLGYGDWIAVCTNNGVARLVVLLQIPEKPFYLGLEGNVTAVNGKVITGNIKGGGTFTIDLTGVSGNFTGAAGQPIELNIGKNSPPAWGMFQGLTMKSLTEGIGLWMRNHGWMMGR